MAFRPLLDMLLPPACAACGRAGSVVCVTCSGAFVAPDDGAFVVADAGLALGDSLTLAIGAFAFTGPMRRVLGRLKYAGAARAAGRRGQAVLPALGRLVAVAGPRAALVPVPLHAARRRERGYNQAELVAKELGRRLALEVASVLDRREATERQHRLDRAARLSNLRGAITLRAGARPPLVAIVVDDILTTSATLEACASVLRSAGCQDVYGFAVAREI